MKTSSFLKLAAACAAAVSLISVGKASASGGFDTARMGSEHGHAAGDTAFALYYNPAALSLTKKLNVGLNLTLAWHGASFDRKEGSPGPADAPDGNFGKAKVSDVLVSPALAAAYRFGDFAVGAGVYVPFAGLQDWSGGNSYPQYVGTKDGSARWHFLEGGITTINASVGASYTIRPARLSFGLSGNLNHTTLNFTRAYNGVGVDDITSEGRSNLDVAALTGSFGVGVLWEALENLAWVGLSYQAPPGLYKDMDMEGKLRLYTNGEGSTNVTLKQSMPDIIRWALRVKPSERYELRLNGDITRWSNFEKQCLVPRGGSCSLNEDGTNKEGSLAVNNQPRDWKNTFAIRLGGSYFFSPMWEGFASVNYDSNAVPAGTLDPSVIDGHDLTYTVGGRARLADMFGVLLAFSYQHWLERDTTGLSRLHKYEHPSRLPNAGGIYNQQAAVLNLMVEFYLN